MSLATSEFISTLINSGADASLNLFTATFRPIGLEGSQGTDIESTFTCRITNVPNLVSRDNTPIDILYQNVNIPKLSQGTNFPKTISFSVRLDDSYILLEQLRSLQRIDRYGNIDGNEGTSKKIKITIEALKPSLSNSETFCTIYKWVFYDCFITAISPINFEYNSTSSGAVTVSFIWKDCEESSVIETTNETINSTVDESETGKLQSTQSSVDLATIKAQSNKQYNTYNGANTTSNSIPSIKTNNFSLSDFGTLDNNAAKVDTDVHVLNSNISQEKGIVGSTLDRFGNTISTSKVFSYNNIGESFNNLASKTNTSVINKSNQPINTKTTLLSSLSKFTEKPKTTTLSEISNKNTLF